MKKTLLVTTIAATSLGTAVTQADIAVTNMVFGPTYGVTGILLSSGGGGFASIDFLFGRPFIASQQTDIMENTGSWSGTSPGLGGAPFDYTATIQAMPAGYSAAGLFFNWGSSNDIAVLAIFDCNDNGSGDACNGSGTPMQNGPFEGSTLVFNGAEVVIPVPAAVWLMGSGLLGLVSIARRCV